MIYNFSDDIQLAQNTRKNAYAKKSEYLVGAVLNSKSGKKYTGCNIENVGLKNICAENVALWKAISEGEREFDYILIIGGAKNSKEEKYLPGEECLKYLSEFVDKDFKIYTVYDNKIEELYLRDLLL